MAGSPFNYPYSNKPTLLGALLRNESGGRNIANTHQGTSSGQAQGYFQITTGTWNDFGGRKYAPTPLGATPQQQWDIAQRIPLKRWDTSTLRAMRATGKAIDPNRTLGENASMHNENFDTSAVASPKLTSAGGPGGGTFTGEAPSAVNMAGPTPEHTYNTAEPQVTELFGADKKKPLGGLLGQMAAGNDVQMPDMPAFQAGAGGDGGGSLATYIQQYLTSQLRGGGPKLPQPGGSRLG